MIVRMCGRCQEEIDKERKRAEDSEKELLYYKQKLAEALKIDLEQLQEKESFDKT